MVHSVIHRFKKYYNPFNMNFCDSHDAVILFFFSVFLLTLVHGEKGRIFFPDGYKKNVHAGLDFVCLVSSSIRQTIFKGTSITSIVHNISDF